MPQTVGCVGTVRLVRDMLRREDAYEGGAALRRILSGLHCYAASRNTDSVCKVFSWM